MTKLKAVILAGGFATRLRPLSCTRPKTLFPIINKPLLQWIFEQLSRDGINDVVLAVNQLTGFYIKQQRIPRVGMTVKYSFDPTRKPLGTGGPIKHAQRFLGQDPFLVLNGDIFTEISYKKLIQTHSRAGGWATLALCHVEDPSRYGVAEVAENGQIKRFIEKPRKGTEPSKLINAGVYVLNSEVLQLIPEGRAVSVEREIFPKLAEQGKLFGQVIDGLWIDIGRPDEYLQANRILLDKLNPATKPLPYADIKRPVALEKDVSMEKGAIIGPYAVLGKNVAVGKNARICDSIVFKGAKIGDSASLEGAIVGEEAFVGDHVRIGRGCVIADHAKILPGISLAEGTSVCPAKEIS